MYHRPVTHTQPLNETALTLAAAVWPGCVAKPE